MRTARRMAGITLLEMLVSLAIFSMVVATVMQFSEYVARRIITVRDDVQEIEQVAGFLGRLAGDVRGGRRVLYSMPTEIGIWRADENADSAPEPAETVGYAWDGTPAGQIYRQDGADSVPVLWNVHSLQFTYDWQSPQTRHVVVGLLVGKTPAAAHPYHLSLKLRASEVH